MVFHACLGVCTKTSFSTTWAHPPTEAWAREAAVLDFFEAFLCASSTDIKDTSNFFAMPWSPAMLLVELLREAILPQIHRNQSFQEKQLRWSNSCSKLVLKSYELLTVVWWLCGRTTKSQHVAVCNVELFIEASWFRIRDIFQKTSGEVEFLVQPNLHFPSNSPKVNMPYIECWRMEFQQNPSSYGESSHFCLGGFFCRYKIYIYIYMFSLYIEILLYISSSVCFHICINLVLKPQFGTIQQLRGLAVSGLLTQPAVRCSLVHKVFLFRKNILNQLTFGGLSQ